MTSALLRMAFFNLLAFIVYLAFSACLVNFTNLLLSVFLFCFIFYKINDTQGYVGSQVCVVL